MKWVSLTSRPLFADFSVCQFPDDISLAVVARGLIDHVDQNPRRVGFMKETLQRRPVELVAHALILKRHSQLTQDASDLFLVAHGSNGNSVCAGGESGRTGTLHLGQAHKMVAPFTPVSCSRGSPRLNHPNGWFCRLRSGHNRGAMSQTIRVALVNDYEIVLEGLRALLQPYDPEIRVVELDVKRGPGRAVDITLLDTYGEEDPVGRVRELVADPTNGAIIVFSFSEVAAMRALLLAGARGFISKAVPAIEIVDGIRAVSRGETVMLNRRSQRAAMPEELRWPGRDAGLTERESELLALLPTGMTNRELAAHLYVSENTIKSQMRGLFAKLGVRNRVQAVTLAGGGLLGDHHRRAVTQDES